MFRPAPPPVQIPLSHLLATDAPLLSPVLLDAPSSPGASAAFFAADPSLSYEHYPASFSPFGGSDAPGPLKLRASPEAGSDAEPLCVHTHQLFDSHQLFDFPSEDAPSPSDVDSGESLGPPAKRPSIDGTAAASKKPRAERVSTKDFIPPDVSGLSKREARLVKNRAAAFLSRQRKREEFETMEIRVAELEQENALLRGATTVMPQGQGQPEAPQVLMSEIEQLRAQLAAAERQAAELNARLQDTAAQEPIVKPEPVEDFVPAMAAAPRSRSSSVSSQRPERSGASLGLMVLLCALPTLLSLPTHSSLPARFSLPLSSGLSHHAHALLPSSGALDAIHALGAHEFDYASSLMDMDVDRDMVLSLPAPTDAYAALPAPALPAAQTLAFADGGALGLGALDISFDARPAEDGKIRVRIHPGGDGAGATRAGSPAGGSMPGAFPPGPAHDTNLGPFLGVGDEPMLFDAYGDGGFELGGSPPPAPAGRRRVRIALKSMPAPGGEGGEWEVEVC